MVIAAIAPHLNAFSILFVLCCRLGLLLQHVKVVHDVAVTLTLPEDAQICGTVLLPEALVDFIARLRCPVDPNTAGLAVNPVAFEGASIGPHQAPIATLNVLVIDDRLFLVWRSALLVALSVISLLSVFKVGLSLLAIDGHEAHLAHEFERAVLLRLETQLSVLQAKTYSARKGQSC